MEASVLRESASSNTSLLQDPRASFLRLQSDERLVSLTRRGNEAAFETLIDRYRTTRQQLGAQLAWQTGAPGQLVAALEHNEDRATSTSYTTEARRRNGAAIDPLLTLRRLGYRRAMVDERGSTTLATGL